MGAITKGFMEKVKEVFGGRLRMTWLVKKPWQITGPCADAEYEDALPNALDYRPFCPATEPNRVHIPHSESSTVYDIKYFTRDQRSQKLINANRRYIVSKAQIESLRKSRPDFFDGVGFPPSYPNDAEVLDNDKRPGNGYV